MIQMNWRNLPRSATATDERSGRADARPGPDDSSDNSDNSDSASDLAGLGGMDDDQHLASMRPPDEPEPLQADGLQDGGDDVPGGGPAGKWVTTKGRSTQSNDSQEKP